MEQEKAKRCGAMKIVNHNGKTKQNGFIDTPDGKSYWITVYKSDDPTKAWPYAVYLKEKEKRDQKPAQATLEPPTQGGIDF